MPLWYLVRFYLTLAEVMSESKWSHCDVIDTICNITRRGLQDAESILMYLQNRGIRGFKNVQVLLLAFFFCYFSVACKRLHIFIWCEDFAWFLLYLSEWNFYLATKYNVVPIKCYEDLPNRFIYALRWSRVFRVLNAEANCVLALSSILLDFCYYALSS